MSSYSQLCSQEWGNKNSEHLDERRQQPARRWREQWSDEGKSIPTEKREEAEGGFTNTSRSKSPRFTIRKATKDDCGDILRLIKELATYENMSNAVKITEKELLENGFGGEPCYYCLIAEVPKENLCDAESNKAVGFAMYYFTYDPWIGRALHLEEFFVMEQYRGLGIGSKILKRVSQGWNPANSRNDNGLCHLLLWTLNGSVL
ncbi:spermidine/spermine N(1)-acetyltransferase-like protein 1 isoform X2 [Xenopus tropicalis]|uniref:Spermidine/spermine N(1)-acetyltransferase-like protein 1 isoform X2 n=1 Tax=Xenopus tropicalis TaxID=8364 RepID=A0A8J1INM0_XENTR|nr:spermidine/spermine N(1)-acetyltransferase-like protein 1 isoform X2 [Xenopus tropicalis]